jgi:hypothetical protein
MNISVEVAKWDARVMEERITELEAKVVSLEKEKQALQETDDG